MLIYPSGSMRWGKNRRRVRGRRMFQVSLAGKGRARHAEVEPISGRRPLVSTARTRMPVRRGLRFRPASLDPDYVGLDDDRLLSVRGKTIFPSGPTTPLSDRTERCLCRGNDFESGKYRKDVRFHSCRRVLAAAGLQRAGTRSSAVVGFLETITAIR